jgi:hypothetical protein
MINIKLLLIGTVNISLIMFLRTKINGNKKNLLIIRLQRFGCKYNPIFKIILTKQGLGSKSIVIEKLGYYYPRFKEQRIVLNSLRLSYLL